MSRLIIDLVLLDITLPDGNGYSVCTTVKRSTNAPVIFLTAMTDESKSNAVEERLQGLLESYPSYV